MKKGWLALLLLVAIFMFYLVKSSYDEGNPALVVNDVGPGQLISGYLNFSFENESSDNEIKAIIRDGVDVEKSMKLFDFMKNAEALGVDFDCWYNDQKIEPCSLVFNDIDNVETFNGNKGENYVGFVLNGQDVSVESLSFEISGTSQASSQCGIIPLTIDFFADGSIDYMYVNPALGNAICSYKEPEGFSYSSDVLLTNNWNCENIKLENIAGKVRIGGWIRLANDSYTTEQDDIFFKIITPKGIEKTCNTTTTSMNYDRVYCDADVFVEPGNYTVCVKASSEAYNSNAFEIQFGNHLGLFAAEFQNQPFTDIVKFNDSIYKEQTGRNLISDINSFLNDFYGRNCTQGCLIPLFINSTQNFKLSNLELKYNFDSYSAILRKFTKLEVEYPEIDTRGYARIPLEAFNLTAPLVPGTYELKIYYSGHFIDDADFDVERVPIIAGIFPREVIVNEPTEFRIVAYSPKGNNIISYEVDWGDGNSNTNSNGIFTHTYSQSGNYQVRVEVTDSESLQGVAYFTIHVGVPFTALNSSINDALKKLNNFETILASEFYASWLEQQLNLQQVKQELTNLSARLLSLGSQANESQLAEIKQQFDSLKQSVPISLESFASYAGFNYFVDWKKIDTANVETATNDTCPYDQESCKKALGIYNSELSKSGLTISGEKKKIIFYGGNEKLITLINIAPSQTGGKLIIELSPNSIYSNLKFDNLGNAVAFDLKYVNFVYDGDIDPYSIVMYATPLSLSDLPEVGRELGEPELYEEKTNIMPTILMIIVVILLITGLIIIWWPYINKLLQAKKIEKERKLFASRADYYNLFNFVSNALRSGQPETQLKQKLLAVGWKKEQIDYVLKKVKGMMKKK